MGTSSNRDGIGARVTAVTGATMQRRDVDGGSGAWSQPSLPVEFGTGSVTTVDSLIVKWPSGAVSTLTNVATNQTLTVTEPKVQVSVTSLNFGNVEKGASSNLTFTVTNTGGGTLAVGSVTSSNPRFAVSPSSASLPASANQLFTVTFSPTSVGSQVGTVTVSHNAAGNPSSVALSGTGIDTTPPAAPAGLTATAGNNQVTLNWTANTESDLSYYIVYRSTSNGFTPAATDSVGRVDKPGTTFTNTGLSAGTYYFKIAAADSSGNKSGVSAQASATLAPAISLSSVSLSLGNVIVGSSVAQTFTVSNTGTAALTVSSIAKTGADTAQFSASPTAFTVNPGASAQTVTVTFTPTGGPGNRSASLSIAHNAPGSPASLPLSGTALAPAIALPESLFAFPDTPTGGVSTRSLTVENTGTADLSIASLSVTGTDASQFTATATTRTVAPGQRAAVGFVAFAPTSHGSKSARLSIAHNAVGSPSLVSLTGAGLPGRIQVLSTALNFGEVEVGKNKVLTLTISNPGTGPLSITSIRSDLKGFTVSDSVFTLSPGVGREISILCAPTAEGALSGKLTVASNDPDKPALQISLSAVGIVIRPAIGIAPDRLDFGRVEVGQTKTLTLTVSNTGRASLLVQEVRVNQARFTVPPDSFRVSPNANRGLSVTFAPATADSLTALLTVRSNDPGVPERQVVLTGKGQFPLPAVDFSVRDASGQPLSSGRAPLAARFSVTNTGGAILRYEWSFGDTNSVISTPDSVITRTYSAPGTYTVTLKAIGAGGEVTRTKERLISVLPAVEGGFGVSQTSGRAPLTVTFADSSQGQVVSRLWEFGDGDTSSVQNPTHVYRAPGAYTVKLTVRGAGGAVDVRTKENLVSIPPVANFGAAPVSGADSLTVAFADSSQGAVSWRWEFGDGDTSAVRNPVHLYRAAGAYTVRLRVTGPGGSDLRERPNFIQVRQGLHADFTATPTRGRAPLAVTFRDSSKGEVTAWLWTFGDGDTSSVRNPSHTYTRVDSFTVTLRVTGPAGSDAKTLQRLITVAQNRPPAQSIPRSPADNAVGVPLNPLLVWGRSIDPDGDPVTYDVFLGAGRVKSTTDTALVVGPLSEATDYTWRVAAHDDRGGTVDGTIRRFRTVGDTLAPVVLQGPAAEGITQTTATVLCATDEPSTLQVEYRVRGGSPAFTSSPADSVRRKEHRIGLSGLASGTTYEYRTLARDAAGNLTTFPDPPYPAFTTLAAADTTAPQFVAPSSAPFISDSSAVVVWTTDERGTSEAAFRLEADTTFVNALPGEAGTEHRVTLKGLRPGTSYIVRVRSEDASRNAAFASLRIVTPARSAAPVRLRLFNVNVEGRTESQAIIAWSTDRPASGLVRYGLTSLLSPSLAQTGDDGVLEHVVTLTRLSPDTEYFYRVVSAAPLPDSSDVFSFRTLAAARTTPPVILEGPLAQGLGEGRVTIVWRTDEVSTGAVAFDTTAILSRIVTAPGTEKDHAVTLTGLTPGTTYFYQVRSTGLARLSAVSRVSSFTTLAARDTSSPTLLEGPTVTVRTSDGFTVDWGTDEISTSEVVYGPPDSLTQSQTVSGLVQRHGVRVSNLRPGTRYAFRVRSADAAGNVRESAAFNVTTLADTLVDRTSPRLVSPPSVAGTTHQEATIVWGTDEPANSLVEFGKSEKALFETQGDPRRFVTAHSVRLTNLSAATTYHYRIASTDAAGNGPAHNPGDLTFTTKAGSDTISARITSGPTVLSVTDRTATLAWTTDELSDTQVDYAAGSDTTASRLREQAVSPEGTTAHRVTLTNLKPDTTYAFRVGSQDLARNFRTFSEGRTFRTQAAPDTVPPDLVSGPTSIEQTSTTATLAWTTDEPTNTVVEYGTKDYSAGQVERGEMEQSHILTLTGLLPDTEYRYRIVSRDREGNGITTDPTITIPPPRTRLRASDLRFRTARVADTTPPVIVEGPTVQISGNNVVVRWVTDELANSRVVYALPADYNRPGLESDAFDARPTTVHLITLAELDLNAQYLFRCVSSDAAGNTVTSGLPGRSTKPADGGLALQPPGGDGGFVTAPVADRQPPVILSGPTLVGSTSTSLTIEWQTDEASNSFVEYGQGERTSSRAEDGTPVTKHRLVLTKLTPGTVYRLVAGSADPSRNGPTRSKPAVGSTATEVDVTPPKILDGASVSYKSDRQAILTWRTDEPSSSTVEYGPGTATGQTRSVPDPATEHRVVLTNLSPNTAYTFRAGSLDPSNNGPTWTPALSFKTDPTPDTTPPRVLEDPKVSAITDETATVTWQTDEFSDSAVRFGTGAASLDFNVGAPEAVTAHRVALTNLKPATTYFLRVSSIDRSGNGPAVSPELGGTVSFTTSAVKDTLPPAPVKAVLGRVGSRVVLLSWGPNADPDLAGYNVYRGAGAESLQLIASNLTEARFQDEGLKAETTYRYAVTALDRAGNEGSKSEAVSLTPSGKNAPTAPKFRTKQGQPLTPTFVVENATSVIGNLTYTFQVSARGDFADVAASATGVKEGNESAAPGLTAWTMDRALTDGATYYLRVRANDGAFDGPFMSALSFRVDARAAERPGDFNGDFGVDFEDFFAFAGAFGNKASGEDARFDLVANGVVDFEDFFSFAGLFGKRYAR